MPLEAQGYSDVESGRVTTFLPGWSPARALLSGASACKLLLPYRPEHEASAARQDEVVAQAVAGCHAAGLPLIVEPIAYPLAGEDAAGLATRLGPIVLATVERLRPIGADILKLQFPRDPDPSAEAGWCRRIDEACADTPWVLLGGGGDADGFARDVELSGDAGASGFIAGRTLWQAALGLEGVELVERLETTCVPLVQRLRALAETHARPWRGRLGTSAAPPADWWSS
jgi:tagatose 1,6-diphosphate aldolase